MTKLNVGVLGLSHDHVWGNLSALATGELGRVAAAAEPDAELRAKLRGLHGGVEIHESFDALLERRDLDAVLIFSDNRTSAELGVRALDRQLPVMIEKPMAADLDGAESMLFAARKRGVPLMVNWPTVWRPALRYGLTLAAEGVVGDPIQVSHRGGHAGPREFGCSPQFSEWLYDPKRNGGGTLVDYCGYGALLCRLVLGQPTGVIAVTLPPRKPDLTAEDNAVVVLSYPRALGLLEASWTQIGGEPAFAMIVYGDRGTLLVHQPRMTHEGERVGPGRVQLMTPGGGNRTLEPSPLADDERDGPTYFLSRIRAGLEVTGPCAAGIGRDVQEVIAAALQASATGRRVRLPLSGDARV
jgi:predicted dehydrogenase